MTIEQIIPCSGNWYAIHTTESDTAVYPVAAWALIDNKVTGLIGGADRNLATVPLGEIAYKTRHQLTGEQLALACPVSIDLEPELLAKVIQIIEKQLQQSGATLSPYEKAEVIAVLHHNAQTNRDWQKQIGVCFQEQQSA